MIATSVFWIALAATSAIPLLILAVVVLVLLVCWLLVFIQQWRGRHRWRRRVQDAQVRRKHAGAAGVAPDCRYDPRLFRRRG